MTGDSTRNAYFRLVEAVDAEIGKILDEIDSQDLWRNTVVIFTSDHGDGAGAHQWNQKTALYEEVVNVPMIVCLPGKRNAGTVSEALVSNGVDFMRQSATGHAPVCLQAAADAASGLRQRTWRDLPKVILWWRRISCRRPARSAGWCAPRNTNTSFTTRGRTGSSFSTWRPTAGRCATLPWKRNTGMYFSSIVKCSASGLRHILQPR